MKKFIKVLSGVVAGVALAAVVSLAGNAIGNNVADAAASSCVKTNGGITVNQVNANAFARIQGTCGQHRVQMKSYYAQASTGLPHEGQVKYADGAIQTLKSGGSNEWVKFNVSMPNNDSSCFYQVDLVDLDTTAPDGHGNFVVASKTGGNRDCTPTPPSYKCVSLTAAKTGVLSASITDYQIAAHNAVYLRTTVSWGDGASDTRVTPQGMGHTYATAGQYTISATSYFQVVGQFGQVHEVAAAPCTYPVTFTPEQPHMIQVCELATKHIITIDENDFDDSKHSKDLSKCVPDVPKNIYVCEIATKNILTIKEDEYGTDKYPKDKYTTDLNKCVAKMINVCDLQTKSIINIDEDKFDATLHTKDLNKCTPTTTPPATLVNTGPGSVAALAGATSVVAAAAHAILRRRSA